MRYSWFVSAALVAACGHGNDPATGGTGSASSAPTTTPSAVGSGGSSMAPPPAGSGSAVAVKPPDPEPAKPPPPPPPLEGHDFTPEAKVLLAVGACGNGDVPENFSKKLVEDHCKTIQKVQDGYLAKWVTPARAFFETHVPKDLPKKVVYPFAGGDLSTALTVFPDADEITTMSLEPAGDPRDLATLKGRGLEAAMKTVRFELDFLYRVNFSNTVNMMDAMRSGALPTQLIFGLSAMKIHGYEVVNLRYFKLNDDGTIHYLDDDDIKKAPPVDANAEKRNRVFANVELQFRKPGGRIQVYRHIQTNLDDEHTKADPRVIKHLESKGQIAAMTKAASYLLSLDGFSNIRHYLLDHAVWMVSDATGLAPRWGKQAGFEYETYGVFAGSHLAIGNSISRDWRLEWESEEKRELPFRFGYYDKHQKDHLVIVRKKKS
jgi:hypothetical protein